MQEPGLTVSVDRGTIASARTRIAGDVRRTPLWRVPGAVFGAGAAEVGLKLEQLQLAGSFKARGMFNRLRAAAAAGALPPAGVAIASGGNAGIAAAAAARALGTRCTVFVPELAGPAKRARLQALGAVLVVGGPAYADALAACLEHQRATGALALHAYDQPEVVAGAGTLGPEIEEDFGPPDRVLLSVGGGGLIAGVAAWFAGTATRVEALEPGEGRLGFDGDPFVGDREGHLGLSEQQVEPSELGEDRVLGGTLEVAGAAFQERDRLARAAAVEE